MLISPSLESYFQYDQWLSQVLKRDVYTLFVKDDLVAAPSSAHEAVMSTLSSGFVFSYAKVHVEDHAAMHLLERLEFNLIDTSIAFERPIISEGLLKGHTEVRFAVSADRQGVRKVAGQSFRYSRFHLDPHIPKTLADEVKASWAENYFTGRRGDNMIVA